MGSNAFRDSDCPRHGVTNVDKSTRPDKPKCGAKRRQGPEGARCTRPAGWGTDHVGTGNCKLHGGTTPNGKKSAQKQVARNAVATYGLPRTIDPATALLEEVHRTAGHVDWLGQVVGELESRSLVWGLAEKVRGGKDPHVTKKAGENAYLQLYRQERAHLVRVTAEAIKAGVEERRVKVEEHRATMLVDVLGNIFDNLDLTDEQLAKVNELVPQALLGLAAGELTT